MALSRPTITICGWWLAALVGAPASLPALADMCQARSGATVTPVVELYTSQGCSSCPPADRWLSTLTPRGMTSGDAVIQAFHVAYWDYIGWVDPFASSAHTDRQRQIAAWNGLRTIYTPQMVLDARDWRDWRGGTTGLPVTRVAAHADITVRQRGMDLFEATVNVKSDAPAAWAAYWTMTENAHQTSVRAGENAGDTLRNDHVVRQYVLAGQYRSDPAAAQTLVLHTVPATSGHDRIVNLVVFDPRNGRTVQALSTPC
jgi:hypothetical protein